MAKTHSFSIYLLREGVTPEAALRTDTKLVEATAPSNVPEGSRLFILDSVPKPPWWKAYFGVSENLLQTLKGALLLVPVAGRWFALTFGPVYHNLGDEAYEYDFGLRVTLNSLDPNKLRSTDTVQPGASQRRRTQLPRESDLTFFDFDRDSTVLKSLTGKVKEALKPLFRQATGSSSLRISSDTLPTGIPPLLQQLLSLYSSEEYKVTFPDIQNITPVREPWVKALLDAKLELALREKDASLILSVPEIVDYSDNINATFSGMGSGLVYEDVYAGILFDYIESKGGDPSSMSLDEFKKISLVITNSSEVPMGRFGLYRALFYETALPGDSAHYHLVEGQWYRVESAYVTRLSGAVDPHFDTCDLPDYADADEGVYNVRAASERPPSICLDKKDISPPRQKQVEPCDVLRLKAGGAEMIHVKRSTLSNQLSHLFNQGANACELIRLEPQSLQALKDLITTLAGSDEQSFLDAIDGDKVSVRYAIVTHKDVTKKSENLPLFSRISLMRALRGLKAMGVSANVCYVKDVSPPKAGKKKARKKKKGSSAAPPAAIA